MSNRSAADIYAKNWTKMSKFITSMSRAIRDYVNDAESEDIPDYDTMLISMYILTTMCGSQWKYSPASMNELSDLGKEIHRLAKASSDSPNKKDMQMYALSKKKITIKN